MCFESVFIGSLKLLIMTVLKSLLDNFNIVVTLLLAFVVSFFKYEFEIYSVNLISFIMEPLKKQYQFEFFPLLGVISHF